MKVQMMQTHVETTVRLRYKVKIQIKDEVKNMYSRSGAKSSRRPTVIQRSKKWQSKSHDLRLNEKETKRHNCLPKDLIFVGVSWMAGPSTPQTVVPSYPRVVPFAIDITFSRTMDCEMVHQRCERILEDEWAGIQRTSGWNHWRGYTFIKNVVAPGDGFADPPFKGSPRYWKRFASQSSTGDACDCSF